MIRHTFLLPAALEDDFVADLWEAGTAGVECAFEGETAPDPWEPERLDATSKRSQAAGFEIRALRLHAYFSPGSEAEGSLAELEERWAASGVRRLGREEVVDTDWLATYRELAQPLAVGDRFWLDPRDEADTAAAEPAPAGRWHLRLPARQAFGTGSHESTRLALRLLEGSPPRGGAVLDVGCGSGVLAFAALLLGAGSVTALDVDPVAAFHARDNARRNASLLPAAPLRLFAGSLACLRPDAVFELVLANILPERILPEARRLAAAVAPGGHLIFSGILAERAQEVISTLAPLGLAPGASCSEGEWIAFRLRRSSAGPPDGVGG